MKVSKVRLSLGLGRAERCSRDVFAECGDTTNPVSSNDEGGSGAAQPPTARHSAAPAAGRTMRGICTVTTSLYRSAPTLRAVANILSPRSAPNHSAERSKVFGHLPRTTLLHMVCNLSRL